MSGNIPGPQGPGGHDPSGAGHPQGGQQPGYGQEQYGQGQYGQDQYGQQPGYGQASGGYDQSGHGQTGYDQSGYGQPQGGYGPGAYGSGPTSAPSASHPGSASGFPAYSPGTQMGTQTTAPPRKSGAGMIGIIIGGAVFLVVAAIIVGVVVTSVSRVTADKAVQAYFDALAAGDADTAISYAKVEPSDRTFLTDEMLATLNQESPITELEVSKPSGSYVSSVPVSYAVGGRRVSTNIRVTQIGKDWKLESIAAEVRASSNGANPIINGVEATSDRVLLFPGRYAITTGSEYVTYPDDQATLWIEEPSPYASATSLIGLRAELTDEGEELVLSEAQKSLEACFAKKELEPEGCPFKANPNTENGAITLDLDTLTFTPDDDMWSSINIRLDYENPLIAQFSFYPRIRYKLTGTRENGGSGEYNYYVQATNLRVGQMDFSTDEPTFSWVAR